MEKQSERTVDITVPARLASRIVEGWKRIDRYEPVLKRALETYGFPAQAAQLTEEVGELLAVLNQYRRGRASAEAVKSELADVAIMVMQMEMHICGDEECIADELDAKMERLEKRLDASPKQPASNDDWARDAHAPTFPKVEVQPTELGGFRVGDLVQEPEGFKRWEPVRRLAKGHGGFWYVYVRKFGGGWNPQSLIRKPVEVGDTVRCVSGPFTGRTGHLTDIAGATAYVEWEASENAFRGIQPTEMRNVVAVAPTVKT